MNWICTQNGAREHYAIPRALSQSGRLEMLLTETWAGPLIRRLPFGPLRPLAARHHPDLAGAQVVHWTREILWRELVLRVAGKNPAASTGDVYGQFIQQGQYFSRQALNFLQQQGTNLQGKVVFSYDTTALELFTWAKGQGAICVLGQMDPARTEAAIVSRERERWPGWSLQEEDVPESYHCRREQEWDLADCIVVNSRWSAEALAGQGVAPQKMVVIPLCYEENFEVVRIGRPEKDVAFSVASPMRVLFLGQVILRKGIQYLIEAAKLLQDKPVHFDVVGPIGISESAIKSAPANLTFHGRANRDQINGWYNQSDVFVLPTISDGFAITQIEAMAHGLPVIATPNCGEVVTDGKDGFIVPARDAAALAQGVRRYLAEPEILSTQHTAAWTKSRQFSLEKLAVNVLNIEHTLKQ